jgi:hypothetical protein
MDGASNSKSIETFSRVLGCFQNKKPAINCEDPSVVKIIRSFLRVFDWKNVLKSGEKQQISSPNNP